MYKMLMNGALLMKNYKKTSKWFYFPFNFIMFIASIFAFIISIIDYKTWIFSCTFLLISISCVISCYKEITLKKSE
ncbi:putative membrane protein [Bacillus pseudomycoides]|nr:putative membrane protein [Bacillus pseudomycoides]